MILEDIPQLIIASAYVARFQPDFLAIASICVTAYCILTKGVTALFYCGKGAGNQVTPYGAPHNVDEEHAGC